MPIGARIAARMRRRAVDLDANGYGDGRRPQTLRKEALPRRGVRRSEGEVAHSARSVSPIVVLVARNGHRGHSLARRTVRHITSRPSPSYRQRRELRLVAEHRH